MPKPLPLLVSLTALAPLYSRSSCQADDVICQSVGELSHLETDCEMRAEIGDLGCSDPCAGGCWHAPVEWNGGRCCYSCGHCRIGFWWPWLCGACDMPPHYQYFPEMQGYYYFRPYHQSHLMQQVNIITHWGGDPRNPYDNAIFQQVYRDHEAAGDRLPEMELLPVPAEPLPANDTGQPQSSD